VVHCGLHLGGFDGAFASAVLAEQPDCPEVWLRARNRAIHVPEILWAPDIELRLYLLAVLVLLGLGVLVARLHKVQVDDYDYYVSRLPGEKEVTVRVPGVRGEIRDRNGMVLATQSSQLRGYLRLEGHSRSLP